MTGVTTKKPELQAGLGAIVEDSEDAIISVSLDGTVLTWNRGASRLFGHQSGAMIGQPIFGIIPEDRHEEERRILDAVSAGEVLKPFDTRRVRANGSVVDVSLTVSPVRGQHGEIIAASKIARDITRNKRAEAARRKFIEISQYVGQEFYNGVVEALAQTLHVRWVLLCVVDPVDTRIARTLAAWADDALQGNFEYELAGTPCANVLNETICFYPENVAALFPDDVLLEEMGATSYLGVPLRGSDGTTLGLLAVLHDQTLDDGAEPAETLNLFAGRAAAELERAATASDNERFGRIIEDAASEVYVFDAENLQFQIVNRGARNNLGYSMQELAVLTPVDIKPALDRDAFEALVAPLRTGAQSLLNFQTIHRRKDGSDYHVDVKLQLLRDNGRPVFYAAIEDVTERVNAARALGDVSRRLDTILNNTMLAVFLMNDRQECIYMNQAAETLTGYASAEVYGRILHEVIHHSHRDGRPFPLDECEIDRAFPTDHRVQGETEFIHKDGRFYPVAFTASPIHDENGVPVGTVIEARDISAEIAAREAMENFNAALKARVDEAVAERRSVEEQLLQAQKMEALGKLTGGIAHDFNNLLQIIGGNLQLLNRDLAGNVRAEQRVQNAMAGVTRAAKLASQLLAFARKQALAPTLIDAGHLLHNMDDMLRRCLGESVELHIETAPDLWKCFVDEAQIENALLNLAINARDAMEGQGRLTIQVANVIVDKQHAGRHSDATPGPHVVIAVADDGCGMPPEVIERIFEPFFTTKTVGKGSGLGLSMVYGLVRQSGGHVEVSSEVGRGTTFRLYLPRAIQQVPEPDVTDQTAGPVTGGSETILVVEDDDDVRETVVDLLSELGYRVLKARDAASGLAIVESGVPIDLLFTDVVMPGAMQSPEMALKARKLLPDLKVLFTSGYTEGGIVHGGRLDPGVDLLPKPHTREVLARRVRSCLDRKER
jgi:PAS domain S-box-containing protein